MTIHELIQNLAQFPNQNAIVREAATGREIDWVDIDENSSSPDVYLSPIDEERSINETIDNFASEIIDILFPDDPYDDNELIDLYPIGE